MELETINKLYLELSQITTATTAREILLQKQLAEAQGDAIPREDFAWLVVQEACETDPADEDDPECIRILRRDLKSAVLAAFLRYDAENHGIAWEAYQAGHSAAKAKTADVGAPVAMVQCHGSAEHPLYTADQLAAAATAARISALCDTLLNRPARKLRGNRAEDCSRHPRREKGEQS